MKTLGIIGGLGPETTSEFYLDVVFSCYERDSSIHPSIIITNVPLPHSVEEDAITTNTGIERIIPLLEKEAQRLEKAGADFIVMPCNSLHVFIENIRESVSVPVLSIIEETVSYIKKMNYKNIGVISTSATIQNKLYETAFNKNNINYSVPNNFEQAKLGKYIHNLVIGQQNNIDREGLIGIIDNLAKKEVSAIALACTDLQLLIPKHNEVEIFDTMKILSKASVKEIFS